MIKFFAQRYVIVITALVIAGIAGCGKKENKPDVFRLNIASGLNSLDPAQMGSIAAHEIGMQIYEGLVKVNEQGDIAPALAKRWEIADSGKTLKFILRSGVKFQNDDCFPNHTGRTVTAGDCKYSFERICDPRTRSTGWWLFHNTVVGADDFHDAIEQGEIKTGVRGFEALDDTTFVVHLTRPFAPFLSMLAMPYSYVVPHEAVEKYGENFFQHPVGAGAFAFDHWTPDVELVLKRNPSYWDSASHGSIETVNVSFVQDTKTEFLQFTKGDLDEVNTIAPGFENAVFDESGNLQGDYKKYTSLSLPALTSEYYGILLDTTEDAGKSSPLATNAKLRQALNYAIDRDAIIRYVLRGQAVTAKGVLPPGVRGYDSLRTAYTYDPAKVKELLTEAGFPDGKGLPTLTLQLGPSEQMASVAEAVQQQLKQAGIQLELRQVDFPQHLAMVREGKLPLWRTQWVADYCDAENFLALFYSKNFSPAGPNTTHFTSAAFDELYEECLNASLPDARRMQAYKTMDSLVVANAPWIFLYYPKTVRLLQPGIGKFTTDPLGYFSLAGVVKQ
ncbi:MAG TPA: ABC transporter substrate-binding protein [Candidatus Kapabacteria bacterium]|nr:ABC transporter substrate-binding protein [Candidatus Kapabacteria bacterium]